MTFAGAAAAEPSVTPTRVEPGSLPRLVFTVPNEKHVAIRRVAIGLPPDFSLAQAELKGGWKTDTRQRTVAWEGKSIMPGQLATFTLRVRAPNVEERAVFPVLAGYADGRTLTYQVSLRVEPAPPPRDEGARTLATAALIVAAVAVLLALGAGLLALWLWFRPRPF
ncbi:MAG TPA: hypothetical protein VFI37_10215 [Gaiellaceae bacterium]|nr:hypothetical protein [Gaiellaceae bacterium]